MSDSHAVLVVGPDAGKVAPVTSYWLYWAHIYREATIIVLSEHDYPLAKRSNHWLPAKRGTEAAVMRAMARIAFDEGLAPAGSDSGWLDGVDVESIAAEAGLDLMQLKEAAVLFATGGYGVSAKPEQGVGSILYAPWEDFTAADAEEMAVAAHNLSVFLGFTGQPGGGVLALRGHANIQGSVDVGCHPALLPGQRPVTDDASRHRIEAVWSERWNEQQLKQNGFVRIREISGTPGIDAVQIRDEIRAGRIKAMYIAAQSHHRGTNKDAFFSSGSDGYFDTGQSYIWKRQYDQDLIDALKELDFLVVEDCFESELTEIADVVLPAAMYLEKDGTFTNMDRTVQRVRFVVRPPGDARSTREHVAAIADRLGYRMDVSNPSAILDEIAALIPEYGPISFPRLERGGLQWPVRSFGAEGTVRLGPGNGLDEEAVQIVMS